MGARPHRTGAGGVVLGLDPVTPEPPLVQTVEIATGTGGASRCTGVIRARPEGNLGFRAGGGGVGTLPTLLFLPAPYALWFRVARAPTKREADAADAGRRPLQARS